MTWIGGAGIRTGAPLLLVLAWALAVHGQPAAASDRSSRPAAGANATGIVPYLSAGVALIRARDTRFVDGRDGNHAALYGSEDLFDAGAVEDGPGFRLAAGVRLASGLRAELEFGLARALDWRGNTNYLDSGRRQPSEARLDTWQLMVAGFHDFPGWKAAPGRRVRPFLGAGLGITQYRLHGYLQRFPEPDDPRGPLRRGPDGEIPFTALPRGGGRNFTWMLTAGIAIPVRDNIHLDLSYRYTDAGVIQTDPGDIAVVRYREDGTRRAIRVPIDETTADYRTQSVLVSLRFDL